MQPIRDGGTKDPWRNHWRHVFYNFWDVLLSLPIKLLVGLIWLSCMPTVAPHAEIPKLHKNTMWTINCLSNYCFSRSSERIRSKIKDKSLKFRIIIKFSTDRHSNRKCRAQIQPALPLLRPFTQSLTVGHQNIRPQSSISMLQGWTGLFLWTAQKNAKLEKPATDLQS